MHCYGFEVNNKPRDLPSALFCIKKKTGRLSFSFTREKSMEGHSGQKCNLIATCIPLDRIRVPLDRTFLPFDRTSIPLDRTFLPFDRTSIPLDRTFLPLDRTFIPLDRTFLPFDRTSIILSLAI